MPPLTCPPKFTYYGFSRTVHPWSEKLAGCQPPVDLSIAHAFAREIEQMRKENPEDNPEDIDEQQMRKAMKLEDALGKNALSTASIVLNFQGSDYFGNERPYNCEPVTEPIFCGINMYKDDCPMLYKALEGQKAVEYREAFRTLASHPYFAEEPGFEQIERVFEAMEFNGKQEDWTLVVICRAYNLHNG